MHPFFRDDAVVGWIVMCLNPVLEIFRIYKTNGWVQDRRLSRSGEKDWKPELFCNNCMIGQQMSEAKSQRERITSSL